jgi:hypothetical protein
MLRKIMLYPIIIKERKIMLKKNIYIMLKKYVISLSLFLMLFGISTNNLLSQEEQYFPPEIGLTLGYKCAVNGFPNPQGRKNGMAFNNIPDAGLTAYIPLDFTYNLGLYIDIGYNTNTFLMKYNYEPDTKEYLTRDRMRFSYISISPTFNHNGFKLGFAVGIPISADWEGVNINTNKLQNIIELKAGYTYPLYFDRVGRLNIFLNATYALNGIYNDFVKDDPLKNIVPATGNQIITNYYNPRPATIQLGLSFLFNLVELPDEYYNW